MGVFAEDHFVEIGGRRYLEVTLKSCLDYREGIGGGPFLGCSSIVLLSCPQDGRS